MSRAPRANPEGGTTLLELLLVIGIVAVLVGLLGGAVGVVIGTVNTVRCRNHLRQIGGAYARYLSDSHGTWPPILTQDVSWDLYDRIDADMGLKPAPLRPAKDYGRPGAHWSIVLYPYLGDVRVYTCPSDPKAGLRGAAVVAPRTRTASPCWTRRRRVTP